MRSWVFSEAENRLTASDAEVQVTPKAAAVLSCLIDHKPQVVSKDQILARVWPGLHVTEDLVREYIFDLRAALGDDARSPAYIATVRGKGFKLTGDVARATTAPASAVDRLTVALLRPVLSGPAPLAEPLLDAVATGLVQSGSIDVVSRHASASVDPQDDLRRAAEGLGAGYFLETRFSPTHLSAFLVDGPSGRHVWAHRFEMGEDSERLQPLADRIVHAIAGWHGELHVAAARLIARKRSSELTAFDHFVCGCDLELNFDAASVTRALDHLDSSLALDPGFARAWVMKSIMLQWSYDVFAEKDPKTLEVSAAAMEKAYLLNPRDPVTQSLIALQRARKGDIDGALRMVSQAEAECGADADACVCTATALCVLAGRFDAARAFFDRAHTINPVPPGWYRFVEARIRFYFGEYTHSIAASKSGPQRVSAITYRLLSQVMLGQMEAALITYDQLHAAYPGFDFGFYADYFPIADPEARGRYDTAVGRLHEALKLR